jgi:hypothetical protein
MTGNAAESAAASAIPRTANFNERCIVFLPFPVEQKPQQREGDYIQFMPRIDMDQSAQGIPFGFVLFVALIQQLYRETRSNRLSLTL